EHGLVTSEMVPAMSAMSETAQITAVMAPDGLDVGLNLGAAAGAGVAEHFVSIYKDLEAHHHSQVSGWGDRADAMATLDEARRRFAQEGSQ
ncbi:MAG: hypothetical protein ACRDPM_04745, partial [Solirubrobacteraceae bacterium]